MKTEIQNSHFSLAKIEFVNGKIDKLKYFIKEFPNSEYCISAYQMIARFHNSKNDTIEEVRVLKEMTEIFTDNANAMNSYAWRMTELNRNLKDALIKAKAGVMLADDEIKPMILDTQAEVEWMLGDKKSAINSIKEALKLDSKNEYYLAQLERFNQ